MLSGNAKRLLLLMKAFFYCLFLVVHVPAVIFLLHGLTWPVLQLFKTYSTLTLGNLILSVELCPIEVLLLTLLFFSGRYLLTCLHGNIYQDVAVRP